jgi:hypothetical protein
MYNP